MIFMINRDKVRIFYDDEIDPKMALTNEFTSNANFPVERRLGMTRILLFDRIL